MRVERDIPYGRRPAQRLDLYIPDGAGPHPVLVFVHGGAWAFGDKANHIDAKVAHWLPQGWIVAAVNYRLLPWAGPREQAADVAQALDKLHGHVARWGGDAARMALVGHSTGAHLAALALADDDLNVPPLVAAVLLDSAALDVVQVMEGPHLPLHDRAFGDDRAQWEALSPWHRLRTATVPLLLVCSALRPESVAQSERYAVRVVERGGVARVEPVPLSHAAINERLGSAGEPTDSVDAFLAAQGLPGERT